MSGRIDTRAREHASTRARMHGHPACKPSPLQGPPPAPSAQPHAGPPSALGHSHRSWTDTHTDALQTPGALRAMAQGAHPVLRLSSTGRWPGMWGGRGRREWVGGWVGWSVRRLTTKAPGGLPWPGDAADAATSRRAQASRAPAPACPHAAAAVSPPPPGTWTGVCGGGGGWFCGGFWGRSRLLEPLEQQGWAVRGCVWDPLTLIAALLCLALEID